MARGDVTIFDEFQKDLGTEVHDLSSDTIKVALVDSTITPAADDATPRWADYSANEVSGTNYVAGGKAVTTLTWGIVSGACELGGDDVGWTMHASGFTDARWAIIYNDTATNDEAIGFVDLGGVASLQLDDVDIEWNAGVIYRHTANAIAA